MPSQISELTANRRTPGRPWKPGQSGNPGGRPAGLGEVTQAARAHTAAAIEVLAELMQDARSETARVAAANAILDRGWGRAPSTVSIDAGQSDVVQRERAKLSADFEKAVRLAVLSPTLIGSTVNLSPVDAS